MQDQLHDSWPRRLPRCKARLLFGFHGLVPLHVRCAAGDDKPDQLIVVSGPSCALFTVDQDLSEVAFTTHIIGDQASDILVSLPVLSSWEPHPCHLMQHRLSGCCLTYS